MTAKINSGWYSHQSNSTYPLSPHATLIDVSGRTLPNNVLADLSISFNDPDYQSFFLASVFTDKKTSSLVISAAYCPQSETPVIRDVLELEVPNAEPYRIYELRPILSGFTGFVVFGEILGHQTIGLRFASTLESGIIRCCLNKLNAAYSVPYIQKFGTETKLDGLVKFTGNSSLGIHAEKVTPGAPVLMDTLRYPVDTLTVIQLTDNSGTDGYASQLYFANALPEWQAAETPRAAEVQPIQRVGTAIPDCNGEISLRFDESFVLAEVRSPDTLTTDGVLVSSVYSSEEICEGRKPASLRDQLQASSSKPDCPRHKISVIKPPLTHLPADWNMYIVDPDYPDTPYSIPSVPGAWDDRGSWIVKSGNWEFSEHLIRLVGKQALAGRNWILPKFVPENPFAGRYIMDVQFPSGGLGSKSNVILMRAMRRGFSGDDTLLGHTGFGVALNGTGLGGKENVIRIVRLHRGFWEPLAESRLLDRISPKETYRLTLEFIGDTLRGRLTIEAGNAVAVIGEVDFTTNHANYGPSWGQASVITYSSLLNVYSFGCY